MFLEIFSKFKLMWYCDGEEFGISCKLNFTKLSVGNPKISFWSNKFNGTITINYVFYSVHNVSSRIIIL